MVGETPTKLARFLLLTVPVLLLQMMIFSQQTTRWGATAAAASPLIQLDGGTTRTALDYQYGRMEEKELLFDSEISRMLVDYQSVTAATNNPNKAVVSDCNRPPRYKSCLPGSSGSKPIQKCDTYTRGCK